MEEVFTQTVRPVVEQKDYGISRIGARSSRTPKSYARILARSTGILQAQYCMSFLLLQNTSQAASDTKCLHGW